MLMKLQTTSTTTTPTRTMAKTTGKTATVTKIMATKTKLTGQVATRAGVALRIPDAGANVLARGLSQRGLDHAPL